jgi:hypothetical protein
VETESTFAEHKTINATEAWIELVDTISAWADLITLAAQETVDSLVGVAETTKIPIEFVVIEETLFISAAALSTPPPESDENGTSENALIPNIISSVHYQITMQKELLFLNQRSKRTS